MASIGSLMNKMVEQLDDEFGAGTPPQMSCKCLEIAELLGRFCAVGCDDFDRDPSLAPARFSKISDHISIFEWLTFYRLRARLWKSRPSLVCGRFCNGRS